MADIVRAVLRLLHRAQHHAGDQQCIRPPLDQLRQLGIVFRLWIVTATERQPQPAEELTQHFELGRRRPGVDSIQHRMLGLFEQTGRAHVGSEHAFLDQLVGVIAHHLHHPFDAPSFVEQHLRFHRFKIDGAAFATALQQRVINLLQCLQVRQQCFTLFCSQSHRFGQNGSHFGVSKTRLRMHHRRVKLVGLDVALRTDGHVARHYQAINLRIERAQPVGKLFRQHRDDPAREVD